MPNRLAKDKETENAMKKLGKKLAECRSKRSLRNVSDPCGIPASQLLSIENGTLAPTSEVYAKLLITLNPTDRQRSDMDYLFMAIRKIPPPDVCEAIVNCPGLISAIRTVAGIALTKQQIEKLNSLLASFAQENTKGDADNG